MLGQNPLKDVDSRVFTRMLRKDGSVTISLRNFVGEGIIKMLKHIVSFIFDVHGM
jgi:hypothetical protein